MKNDMIGALIVGIGGKAGDTADQSPAGRAIFGGHQGHLAVAVDLCEARSHDVAECLHRDEEAELDFFGCEPEKTKLKGELVFRANRTKREVSAILRCDRFFQLLRIRTDRRALGSGPIGRHQLHAQIEGDYAEVVGEQWVDDQLVDLASIAEATVERTDDLKAWLADPHAPMPNLSLTRWEIGDLFAYLESLNEE